MRALIVKISLQGDVYIDGKAADADQMAQAIRQLNADDGAVIYYRESPETEGSAAAADAFKRLFDLRPARIQLGNKAPSQWGSLEWLEIEEAPNVSRIFLARGEKYLIAFPRTPGRPPQPVHLGGPLPPDRERGWLGQFDFVISSDRVIETKPHHPELCLVEAGQHEPSLHIRISYGEKRRWASRYLVAEVPSNIASFHADAFRIARRMTAGPGTELSAADAARFFDR